MTAAGQTAAGLELDIEGMTCASCVARVERALGKVEGVSLATVNLATESAEVAIGAGVDPDALLQAVRSAGYEARLKPADSEAATEAAGRSRRRTLELARRRRQLVWSAALSVLVLVLAYGFPAARWSAPVQLVLALPVYAWAGMVFHRGALRSARHGTANMDTLVSLGSTVAFAYSVAATVWLPGATTYFDVAALIVTLIGVGKYLELFAKGRAGEAIEALAGLQPDTAHLLVGWEPARGPTTNGAGVGGAAAADKSVGGAGAAVGDKSVGGGGARETDVRASQLEVGDVVLVRPGEAVPADAEVLEGDGRVDESMLTGEAVPVARRPGDEVTGGSVNGLTPLVARVSRVGSETTLSRIMALVSQAQADKSNAQRLADRVSAVFVPVILAIAALTFAGWLVAGHSLVGAIIPAVAVLVVACPCALGLATPVAIMVSTGRGAEMGLLVRGGETLERVRDLKVVVLDKTGTLTAGHPAVVTMRAVGRQGSTRAWPGAEGAFGYGLAVAAAVESRSEHPLARAIVAAANAGRQESDAAGAMVGGIGLGQATIAPPQLQASEVRTLPGKGVVGRVLLPGGTGEVQVRVGSIAWLAEEGVDVVGALQAAGELGASGETPVGVASGPELVMVMGIADPLRPDAAAGVAYLRSLGLSVVLATGDSEGVANAVAAAVRPDEVRSQLSPAGKAALVEELQGRLGQVAMVGDGINDAPALAAADVGIAVGGGTGAAMAAADITLVHGDVRAVADAIALARATRRIIWQNLGWAFGYNVVLVPLAAVGILPPVLAAVAMASSSVSVVTNALRLKRFGRRGGTGTLEGRP
ncbi:MAG: heavy metal translocating P-type ATPase [Acidimicrobiales bacterium]